MWLGQKISNQPPADWDGPVFRLSQQYPSTPPSEANLPWMAFNPFKAGLSQEEKLEALDAHPAIGAKNLSARSAAEQGGDDDQETLAELDRLNAEYEQRFGFRFVVFVNRRQKSEIVPILRERLANSRDEELDTAINELVAIAEDRWRRS
jgi:2-oxo-4-hydroxy-4-carboxy--5-ureidoimidazoline (OHCU) decarboxylase